MCDTLVVLPESSLNGFTIFGKNSDRPQDETQLISFYPREFPSENQLDCTYITIPQVKETYSVLLSQPWWMWGAEMGVNEYGVAIGNEAVHTKEILVKSGLLGMDLLRLTLERSKNADEALKTIITLLEKFGQGGSNSYGNNWYYHNSFLIADPKKAWVLETANKWWIAEKVQDVRSISNNLSIRGKGDKRKKGIIDHAIKQGYIKDVDEFDFAINFSKNSIRGELPLTIRAIRSTKLLEENNGKITIEMMMDFLRDHISGICMHGVFESTGSQVSQLKTLDKTSIHWFTGTSKPCLSIYKPYAFPAEDFETLKPGPYDEIKEDWQWVKHKNYIQKLKSPKHEKKEQSFINKSRMIESKIIKRVREIERSEHNLTDNEFIQKIKNENLNAWEKSSNLILED
ncbi:MAG: C69 family dipeptidase [Candidatus Lokiarchaeota archaeon]